MADVSDVKFVKPVIGPVEGVAMANVTLDIDGPVSLVDICMDIVLVGKTAVRSDMEDAPSIDAPGGIGMLSICLLDTTARFSL